MTRSDKKKLLGLCYQCSSPAEPGRVLCLKHSISGNEASKRMRAKKKSAGVCLQCEAPATDGVRCTEHAKVHREDYRRALEAGKCPSCGQPSRGSCGTCKEKQRVWRKSVKAAGRCPSHVEEGLIPGVRCRKCARTNFESNLRASYGLSVEEYAWMELEQSRKCKICLEIPVAGLVVDHNHKTGAVRALLCGPCNRTIGHAEESPERLLAAARYLNAGSRP